MKNKLLYIIIFTVSIIALSGCSTKGSGLQQLDSNNDNCYMRINISGYPALDIKLFNSEYSDYINDFIKTISSSEPVLNTVIKDFCIGFDYSNQMNTNPEKYTEAKYYPIRGAVCVPVGSSSNNFIIISSDSSFIHNLEVLLSYKGLSLSEYLHTAYGCSIPEDELEIYRTYGGAPWLTDTYTVIGQVYSGIETLDEICMLDVDEQYCPLKKIDVLNIDVIE